MDTYSAIGEGLGKAIKLLLIICCISVPLGLWKIIDIVVWVMKNINIAIVG